ncbi:effector-associated constant component EACC1 [Nocardia sp. NPDC004278]
MIITADSSEELRDLGEYLPDADELRGRVRQRLRPPGPEDMGPVPRRCRSCSARPVSRRRQ